MVGYWWCGFPRAQQCPEQDVDEEGVLRACFFEVTRLMEAHHSKASRATEAEI